MDWLNNKEIPFSFHDIKKDPLSTEQVFDIVRKLSLETVVNKKGTTWRSLGLADASVSDDELFDLLVEHQSMIKRPVLVRDDEAILIGFDADALESFLEE